MSTRIRAQQLLTAACVAAGTTGPLQGQSLQLLQQLQASALQTQPASPRIFNSLYCLASAALSLLTGFPQSGSLQLKAVRSALFSSLKNC